VRATLPKRLVAEGLGTAFLLMAIVGSGIMAERLAGGNVAVALLANAIATGAALVALILTFGPISGAHLNPAVTLALTTKNSLTDSAAYILVQVIGAVAGTVTANLMFNLPPVVPSNHARLGPALWFSEIIATFGLLILIRVCMRTQPRMIALVVGAYITAGYWFTSSTSFANPAVTVARSFSDTFTGIRPADVPLFVLAQLAGAGLAVLLTRWLISESSEVSADAQ